MAATLYTPDILRLAVASAAYPRLPSPDGSADGRTPVCGSRIGIDIARDGGRITAVGFAIHACAFGQASAALFAVGAIGRTPDAIAAAHDALAAWLTDSAAAAPDWPGIAALAPARQSASRHAAILLAFDAGARAAADSPLQRTVACSTI